MDEHFTPREARFVEEYPVDLHGTNAAIRAGFSPKWAHVAASRLLKTPKIADAIAERLAKRMEKVELSAEAILEEIRRLALSDIGQVFDEAGNLLPVHKLPAAVRACIASIEVKHTPEGDRITKLRLWPKGQSLELAAKHLALLVDRVEVSGEIELRVSRMTDEQRAARAAALIDSARGLGEKR